MSPQDYQEAIAWLWVLTMILVALIPFGLLAAAIERWLERRQAKTARRKPRWRY